MFIETPLFTESQAVSSGPFLIFSDHLEYNSGRNLFPYLPSEGYLPIKPHISTVMKSKYDTQNKKAIINIFCRSSRFLICHLQTKV